MTLDRHAPWGDAATVSDPLTGRILDQRYRIGHRIARGGMATVYEALDLRLDRTVAVKVMHPGLGDDQDFAARFVAEARAAARLSHPNVVAVFDQGTDRELGNDTVFLAMELVPGHTLRDVIGADAPLSPARALAILEPVVSALAAAHRAGRVHRDVKPENVLIADDGRVKVADFGLAKAVTANTQHTATGVLIGTVSYIAPELVVEGRSDARADVYAVGVILYELLTGRKPHQGETPIQVAYKHVHEDVPAPSQLAPGVPAYVDALVARATARDREQRPADAGVLLHQLRRVNQAVTSGVRSDPDLVADLAPRRGSDTRPVASRTEADPWDHAQMAALLTPPRESTTTFDRGPHPEAPPPRARKPRRADRPPSEPPPRRRRRRGSILLVLALLVAAAVGTGAWWFGYARYTTTPGVIGLTQDQASARLKTASLDVTVGTPTYSSTVPKGRVVSTDPAAGDRVLHGAHVTVVLSRGKELFTLPTLKGLTVNEAQDAIMSHHLAYGTSTKRYSEKTPANIVMRSTPKSGTTLRPGTTVDLVVSKGRRPISVGSWTGTDAGDATRALQKRGLTVDASDVEYSDTVPQGEVISQNPTSGTLFRGDKVTLVVSKGPQLVTVPHVRGEGIEAATAELEGLGFNVTTQDADGYLGLGYVWQSDPTAGTQVPKGSTITLSII